MVQTRQRSSALLMAKHYSPEQVMEIESNVTKRWEKLVTCAEDRSVLSDVNWCSDEGNGC